MSANPYTISMGEDPVSGTEHKLGLIHIAKHNWPEGGLRCVMCDKAIRKGDGCYVDRDGDRYVDRHGHRVSYWHIKCAIGYFIDPTVWDIPIGGR